MNGKKLRKYHRADMRQSGGLVQERESRAFSKTEKYVPFRKWLRLQSGEVLDHSKKWFENKRLEKRRRRIVGPRDPLSASKRRSIRRVVEGKISREERKPANKKAS